MQNTQREWVVKRLKRRGRVTRNACLRNYISRLGSIIHKLTCEGWVFETRRITNKTLYKSSFDYEYRVIKQGD